MFYFSRRGDAYWLLIRLDLGDVRYGAIALILLLTTAVSAPFGLALSALLPRELEGMLYRPRAA